MNLSDCCPVTQLQFQFTACVFGSNYAFSVIAEGLTVWPFAGSFFSMTYHFANTRLWSHLCYFEILMMLRMRLSYAFHYLVPNAFWRTLNVTYMAVKNASWQIWLQIEIGQLWQSYEQNTIYESLVLLIWWWIPVRVCVTGLCLLIVLTYSEQD